ncbi:transcription repressor OFP7-like [Salvia hispanica]|uniref:transcription repressor OFP7-like n=1 Tax=Salvia hispanica TaxID=49212 RepID=UPI002009D030|nr:transcription repressor OFP7-like [Salvia hispanica]
MAKHFKLRICRAIATTLQSCLSKHPSDLPTDPVPSLSHSSDVPQPHAANNHSPQFNWQKEEKWHVVAEIPAPPPPEKIRRRSKKKKRYVPSRLRLSTSSADSGWFSTEEIETLVSSSPLSSSPIGESHRIPRRRSRRSSRSSNRAAAEGNSPPPAPARLSMLKKLIPCTVEGKVKESFAIVKKSEDPLGDFRRSMMDMIVEKQMYEKKDLEQLLQCFLSLNSRSYHGVIVEAFSEIWAEMFAPPPMGNYRRRRRVSRVIYIYI